MSDSEAKSLAFGCQRCGYDYHIQTLWLSGARCARLCIDCCNAWAIMPKVRALCMQQYQLEAELKLRNIGAQHYASNKECIFTAALALADVFLAEKRRIEA